MIALTKYQMIVGQLLEQSEIIYLTGMLDLSQNSSSEPQCTSNDRLITLTDKTSMTNKTNK